MDPRVNGRSRRRAAATSSGWGRSHCLETRDVRRVSTRVTTCCPGRQPGRMLYVRLTHSNDNESLVPGSQMPRRPSEDARRVRGFANELGMPDNPSATRPRSISPTVRTRDPRIHPATPTASQWSSSWPCGVAGTAGSCWRAVNTPAVLVRAESCCPGRNDRAHKIVMPATAATTSMLSPRRWYGRMTTTVSAAAAGPCRRLDRKQGPSGRGEARRRSVV